MPVNPSRRQATYPISIFIQVQSNSLPDTSLTQRKERCLAIRKIKRHCKCIVQHAKSGCKNGSRIAKKAKIPILEDSGNEDWSTSKRVGAAITFLVCIVAAVMMCLFLEQETTKKPVEEELVGVDISKGPLPAVEVRLENMFTSEFLNTLERTLSADENRTIEPFNIDTDEKISLAYLVGQLAAGKPPIFNTILRFLDSVNRTGYKSVPINNPNEKAMSGAIELVKSGSHNCGDIIKNCKIRTVPYNCTELFIKTITPKGVGCSFNIIPFAAIEKVGTVRAALSEEIPIEDLEYWKHLDKDGIAFSNEKNAMGSLQSQESPGEGNGISFEVFKPHAKDMSQHFLLSVGNPRDHATTKAAETKFALWSIHRLNLDVTAEYSTSDVKEKIGQDKRKCLFYDEGKYGNYDGYTFQRCFSSSGAKRRGCLLVSEISHGENTSLRLCHPSEVVKRLFLIEEQGYRLQGHTDCPKSCNDIHYSFTPKSDLLLEESLDALYSARTEVHLFFSKDDVTVRVKDLKGFTAEQIGIVLGMLGFCNELTLPRMLNISIAFLVYAAIKLRKQIAQMWAKRQRNANRPPTVFLS